METVTLFIADERNRQLLATWLEDGYDVSTPTEARIGVGTDIVLVDDTTFPKLKDHLSEWKSESEPVFAPVLLMTEEPLNESFDPEDWETIDGLYVIDEVVSVPIKKTVLQRRLSNLLERRELSDQLEQRFRRSEQRFETLFSGIPDPVFVITDDGMVTDANDAFREWCGLSDPVESSLPLADIESLSPDSVTRIENATTAAFSGTDSPLTTPTVAVTDSDGEQRFAAVSVAPLEVEARDAAVVVLRDVTERQRREKELQETERRFRQIAKHVSEMIWLAEADGSLLYVSPGYEGLTGRHSDDLAPTVREAALDHVHEADRERLEAHFEQIIGDIRTGETVTSYNIEYRIVRPDGEHRWVQSDTYPVRGADGSVTRLVGILDDITDLKQRERRFNAIFNHTFQLTGLVEPDGTVLEINDRTVEYLEVDREHVVGNTIADAADDLLSAAGRERLAEKFATAADGEFVRYEATVDGAEGQATLDISIKPITDGMGTVVLLVFEGRDVTERKRRERELARQNERLEQFASIVSHDLRNPLQIIRARLGITTDTGEIEHLDAAKRAVDRMDRLIHDLLSLAQQGDLTVDTETVSLSTLATRAWLSVEDEAATLDVVSDADVTADPDRLTQLLENLFRNAVEHGSTSPPSQAQEDAVEHGSTDTETGVTVRVGTTEDGFFVADDGPGIPPEERESVFELGHTTDASGTGFGLAIVTEIVEAHGWSISVTDSVDGGARFEISGVER